MDNIFYSTEEKLLEIDRLMSDGNYPRVKRMIGEVLDEQPDNAWAHMVMGWLYHWRLMDLQQAEFHFQLAAKFNPLLVEAHVQYILLLNKLNKAELLQAVAEKALRIAGCNEAFVSNQLALSYERNGNFAEAVKWYNKAILSSTDSYESDDYEVNLKRVRKKLELQQAYVYSNS